MISVRKRQILTLKYLHFNSSAQDNFSDRFPKTVTNLGLEVILHQKSIKSELLLSSFNIVQNYSAFLYFGFFSLTGEKS